MARSIHFLTVTNQKPIEPLLSRELVQQWRYAASNKAASITGNDGRFDYIDYIVTKAAQWGYKQRAAVNEAELQKARDEELEACCEWLVANDWAVPGGKCLQDLRAARRPKPKSQAEEAIAELDGIATCFRTGFGGDLKCDTIRAALERLRELEEGDE